MRGRRFNIILSRECVALQSFLEAHGHTRIMRIVLSDSETHLHIHFKCQLALRRLSELCGGCGTVVLSKLSSYSEHQRFIYLSTGDVHFDVGNPPRPTAVCFQSALLLGLDAGLTPDEFLHRNACYAGRSDEVHLFFKKYIKSNV